MPDFKMGDVVTHVWGDDVGRLAIVVEITTSQGQPWVKYSWHPPHPLDKQFSGCVPGLLRHATREEYLFWDLGVRDPGLPEFVALAAYVNEQVGDRSGHG